MSMSDSITIEPIKSFSKSVRPPGSKSLTNRALLLAALADGESVLLGPLLADDSRHMLGALQTLGFAPELSSDGRQVKVKGLAGKFPETPTSPVRLHLGNAGTAYRFLTAALAAGSGVYDLDGIPRMRERPVGQLVDALRVIGGRVQYLGNDGFPPLRVAGGKVKGGSLTMEPTLSSQYISALLQAAPYFEQGLTLNFHGPVTSRPYVEMTLALMARFGVHAKVDSAFTSVRVEPGCYKAISYPVEPDASNASYFLAAAAVVPGSKITIEGLGKKSLQGDVGFADVLYKMGAGLVFGDDFITVMAPENGKKLKGIDIDLNDMPDMAQTLACAAVLAEGPTYIRNIGNLRVKETDRLEALRAELTKLGAKATIEGDDLEIEPPASGQITPAAIDTYNDHRMAMSFAVIGLARPGVTINDPKCVDKTFPDYFEFLRRLST
jgi:3-phosphoshikimate 1-carboxyvinyltransferase